MIRIGKLRTTGASWWRSISKFLANWSSRVILSAIKDFQMGFVDDDFTAKERSNILKYFEFFEPIGICAFG